MKQKYFRKISYKRLILTLGSALLFFMVAIFMVYQYSEWSRERIVSARRQATAKNIQLAENFWDRMNTIQNYYMTAVQSESVQWMLENEVGYQDYSKYSNAQNILTMTGQEVTGFALINWKSGWILSHKGFIPLEQMENRKELESSMKGQGDAAPKNYWLYLPEGSEADLDSRDYRRIADLRGINFILKLPLNSYNEHSALLVNISDKTFSGWIKHWLGEYEEVVILENDGSLVYASDTSFLEECMELQQNQAGDTSEPIQKKTSDGTRKVLISLRKSVDIMNWTVCLIYDMDKNFLSEDAASDFWLLGVLGLLLLVVILVLCLIYYPLGLLIKNVVGSENVGGNELYYISDRFQHLNEDKANLEGIVQQQKGQLEELFEARMIRGEVSAGEWAEYIEALGKVQFSFYESLVVVLDDWSHQEEMSNLSDDAICLNVLRELPDALKEAAYLPPICHSGNIYIMLAGEDRKTLEMKSRQFCRELTEYILSIAMIPSVRIGISAIHGNYEHIYNSYRESLNALLGQRIEDKETNCFFYLTGSELDTEKKKERYDYSYEKAIQRNIRSLDAVESYRITDELVCKLEESKKSPEEVTIIMIDYINAILYTMLEMNLMPEDIFSGGIEKIYHTIVNGTEITRTGNYIKNQILKPVFEQRKNYINSVSEEIAEKVYRLIQQRHGNITLYECSERLHIGETDIWKALKQVSEKSFSDITDEYKLEEAKRQLLDTDKKVLDIALELGYSNTQNFIRFFSKYVGMTPGKYRRLH